MSQLSILLVLGKVLVVSLKCADICSSPFVSQEDIQNEYVHQEQKRAWNEFKHSVIVDVINANGIRPGYGKWAK